MHKTDRPALSKDDPQMRDKRTRRSRLIHRDDRFFPRQLRATGRRGSAQAAEGDEGVYAWYRPDLRRSFAGTLSGRDRNLLPQRRWQSPSGTEGRTFPRTILIAADPGAEEEIMGAMLAERLGYRHASLSLYLQHYASQTSWGTHTDSLEFLMDRLLVDEGPTGVWRRVIASAQTLRTDEPMIIDGVRRVELTAALPSVVSSDMVVVYYDVDEDVRRLRLAFAESAGWPVRQPSSATEDALAALREEATMVVTGDPRRAVADAVAWLSKHFGPPEREVTT